MELEKHDGSWKDRPIKYSVLLVQVTNMLGGVKHWARGFVGDKRQAVKVEMSGHRPFYLDNEDGTGLKTVTKGSTEVIHRNLGEPKEIEEVPKKEWIKKVDAKKTKEILKATMEYWAGKGKKKSGIKGHGSVDHGPK